MKGQRARGDKAVWFTSDGFTFTSRRTFEEYDKVRETAEINMMNAREVSEITGMNRAAILHIMKNFGAMKKQFEENPRK